LPPPRGHAKGRLLAALHDSRAVYLRWKREASRPNDDVGNELVWNGARIAWYGATVGGSTCDRVTLRSEQTSFPWIVAVTGVCGPKYVFPLWVAAASRSTSCHVPCSASAVISFVQMLRAASTTTASPVLLFSVFTCFCSVLT